jgi:hypothetical protein
MTRLHNVFWFAVAVLPLHGAEQLLFGIDELYELRSQLAPFYTLSDDADRVTVVLVFAAVIAMFSTMAALLTGGKARLVAATFLGLQLMYEFHHVTKTIARGEYFPGAVTSLALVAAGMLLIVTAWREFSSTRISSGVTCLPHGQTAH